MAFDDDTSSSSDSSPSDGSIVSSSSDGSLVPSLEAMSVSGSSCVSEPAEPNPPRGRGRPPGVCRTPLDNLGRRLSTSLRGYDPAELHIGRTRSATGKF